MKIVMCVYITKLEFTTSITISFPSNVLVTSRETKPPSRSFYHPSRLMWRGCSFTNSPTQNSTSLFSSFITNAFPTLITTPFYSPFINTITNTSPSNITTPFYSPFTNTSPTLNTITNTSPTIITTPFYSPFTSPLLSTLLRSARFRLSP